MAAQASPRMRQAAAAWTAAMGKHRACSSSRPVTRSRNGSNARLQADIKDRVRVGYKLDLSGEPASSSGARGRDRVSHPRTQRYHRLDDRRGRRGSSSKTLHSSVSTAPGHFAPRYFAITEPVKFQGDTLDFIRVAGRSSPRRGPACDLQPKPRRAVARLPLRNR